MPISVTIDGREVVSAVVEVGDQHRHVRFPLKLKAGAGTLEARAGDGTMYEAEVAMPKAEKRWGVLSFWPPPRTTPRSSTGSS